MLKTAQLLKKLDKGGKVRTAFNYRIYKVDNDQQLVHGVVYSPWTLDTHGHYMSDVEVAKTCYSFLANGRQKQVDVMHNNELIDAIVVESYIEKHGNADVPVGSWCATTKINDPSVWRDVKLGRLNGYSMEIMSYSVEHDAEITYDTWVYGETQPDPFDGHTHLFLVKMDREGNVDYGYTSPAGPDLHSHTISRLSVTDPYQYMTHRIIL